MNILFVNCCTSATEFNKEFASLKIKPEASIQNYFQLLNKGLANAGCELFTLCERQISTVEKGLYRIGKCDEDSYGRYYYVPKLLIPGLSQIFSLLVNFVLAIKYIIRFRPDVVICDVMRFYISTPTKLATKIMRVKCIGYAADLPQMYNHQFSKKQNVLLCVLKSMYSCPAKSYDAYLLLSKYMNELINPNDKPFIVVEGLVDTSSPKSESTPLPIKHNGRTVFMYAGGLHAKSGVRLLIDSVLASKEDVELWLFGKGDQEKCVMGLASNRIKYFGYQSREFVLQKQMEADFLINPRYSHKDYTKYSFPSKIMEYMASAVPVVTTHIKGIPDEYFQHLIPIEEETIEGFEKVFEKCIAMNTDNRRNFGLEASLFVQNHKNCNEQGKKLSNWLNTIVS